MAKALIIYYSFEGNTKLIAEHMAEHLHADIQEIKPEKEVSTKGFGKYIWGGSQVMMGKSPKLLPLTKKIDEYDVIFVGTPIWAATYAPPIKTLLEGDYIKNKKIAYFYTYQGGAGKAEEKARQTIEKNNIFLGAKEFLSTNGSISSHKEEAAIWADLIMKA